MGDTGVVKHGHAVSRHDGKTDRRRDLLGLTELPEPERRALFRDERTHAPVLSSEEKHLLFRDGFVVVRNMVSRRAVEDALVVCSQLQTQNPGQPGIGSQDATLVGLYSESVFAEMIEEAIGPHTTPIVGFLAVGIGPLPRSTLVQAHVDGGYAGPPPGPSPGGDPLTHSEILESGQELHTWGTRDDPRMLGPSGGAPLWQDPGKTLSTGSFTAFCGVCLNDQTTPGDGVIALHSCPHTASPNLSDDPRMNIYFRIRRMRQANPHEGNRKVGWGVSDHPDRAMNGDFLIYPKGWDPYKHSIDMLCDHWQEWDGMQEVVREGRAAEASASAKL